MPDEATPKRTVGKTCPGIGGGSDREGRGKKTASEHKRGASRKKRQNEARNDLLCAEGAVSRINLSVCRVCFTCEIGFYFRLIFLTEIQIQKKLQKQPRTRNRFNDWHGNYVRSH